MKILNGLHICREIRKKCIDENHLYTENGKLRFDTPMSARVAVQNIAKEKNVVILSSELFLMSILETLLLTLARKYVNNHKVYFSQIISDAKLKFPLKSILGEYEKVFPANDVYEGYKSAYNYVSENNISEVFLELTGLDACEKNPAYKNTGVVFENNLKESLFCKELFQYANKQIKYSPYDEKLFGNLYDIFTLAYREHPDSVVDQLVFLLEKYPELKEEFGQLASLAIDTYKEETKPVFFGPGESKAPGYDDIFLTGAENYTKDVNWMPNTVMQAKNALVWLHQLSEKYEREIKRLDQIPDEELDELSDRGINALWLIGVWERSIASKQIKQWTGNPEAESSAYSLKSYTISENLGGYDALRDLRNRAKARNIRLAADMVPNHTSVDSPAIYENPDRYLQLNYCPFPNYSFSGVSLSGSDKYGVFLEDHYFDRTDAAVVFKYEDYETHKVRYIYHGNDGTNMPWNDTAQLDYLKEETRNAVKKIILDVAREFSIIRFDAAMTLTKKHFQRLWYPEPGSGGDIPTRASHGLTKAQFDEFFPNEFWREVVDMINCEAPDTLLLAEAFWLLEGYFVRTLGMHRVYNSAFMNMLRDEENSKYRDAIKLTLEYDREILKRYVNFMSNPDEKTAIEQFGEGDKYFGICMMMATLPGLPMFAHGQFEGYREKYGMEYSRSYWNESLNQYIVDRHKREVFPILKKRKIFSDIENFRFFDFQTEYGTDENVFVYTNKFKKDKGLFIYNNVYRETKGCIKDSVSYKDTESGKKIRESITDVLELTDSPKCYLIYKDMTEGLEYIVSAKDIFEKGLCFNLKAYEYHLLMNFRVVMDDEWAHYGKLWDYLKGKGVPSIKEAYDDIVLGPLHAQLKRIFNREVFDSLWKEYETKEKDDLKKYYFFEKVADSFKIAKEYAGGFEDGQDVTDTIYRDWRFILNTNWKNHVNEDIITEKGAVYAMILWMMLRHFGQMKYGIDDPVLSASFVDEWKLKDYILALIPEDEYICSKEGVLETVVHIIKTEYWTYPVFEGDKTLDEALKDFILLDSTGKIIKVNRFDNILWFNRECALMLAELMKLASYINCDKIKNQKKKTLVLRLTEKLAAKAKNACEKSEYKLDNLLKLL